MNVAIFGATGMIGAGVLLECLDDERVRSVLVVTRKSTGRRHAKLTEVIYQSFFAYESLTPHFKRIDACFFCLGVSAAGKSEEQYHHLTYDLTLAAARALHAANPGAVFCYVSGMGTDRTERGRVMWARVKGKTENALLGLGFKAAYMLRPGFIEPLRGVQSSTRWYRAAYVVARPLFPLLRRLVPRHVTTTVNVGRAMIRLARGGFPGSIIDPADINALAAAEARSRSTVS
jgi:uncharacterized protein YbjT (DUF2867 family)